MHQEPPCLFVQPWLKVDAMTTSSKLPLIQAYLARGLLVSPAAVVSSSPFILSFNSNPHMLHFQDYSSLYELSLPRFHLRCFEVPLGCIVVVDWLVEVIFKSSMHLLPISSFRNKWPRQR